MREEELAKALERISKMNPRETIPELRLAWRRALGIARAALSAYREDRGGVEGPETAWLIELWNEGPQWFCGGPDFNWTRESLKAIRFSRKEDAEQFASWCTINAWTGVKVTEHQWG